MSKGRFIEPVFAEFKDALEKNDLKASRKLKQELSTLIRKNPRLPPFDRAAEMLYQLSNGNEEEAIITARYLADLPDIYQDIVESVIQTLTYYNYSEELIQYIAKVHKAYSQDIATTTNYFFQLFVNQRYNQAQIVAMELYRLRKSMNHALYASAAAYVKAVNEKRDEKQRNLFFTFAVNFAKQSGDKSMDSIRLVVESLLELGKPDESISYLNENKESFDGNEIMFHKLMVKCLEKSQQFKEAANFAQKFIEEICQDSLDDWKLIINHHENPESLIEKYIEKYRGAFLAKIELTKKKMEVSNNDQITSQFYNLILEYSNKYANRGFVLGDLRPYLCDKKLLSHLVTSTDVSIRSFATGKFEGEVSDAKTASIFAEFCMMKFLNDSNKEHLIKAVSILLKHNSQENHAILVRLAGLLDFPLYQIDYINKLRIDNIQFFSLGAMALSDLLRNWELTFLEASTKKIVAFIRSSLPSFSAFIQSGFNRNNFFASFDGPKLKKDIEFNEIGYFFILFDFLLHILNDKNSISEFSFKKIIPIEFLEETYYSKTDESILQLYFEDDSNKLHDLIYPSFHRNVVELNTAMNLIYTLKLNHQRLNTVLPHVEKLGGSWTIISELVKTGKVPENGKNSDFSIIQAMTMAAIAILLKDSHVKNDICEIIENEGNKVSERIKGNPIPEEWKERLDSHLEISKKAANQIIEAIKKP
ncbi:hypothetical protein TRFO_31583 [Tritrichomonas foetus]|uniref:Uncharacterized protein n=1 Tax=Tritrichomonas foetus TaxID=1144522 RepID=A0A1J4JW83_9EUKA|nr:hypothetical protein TRFO_31583 [Tritrichomonas foetus]|eukprot:OHT01549.1 hypothetical protein TRFO_31583 [Tritrichomonas foetus]